MVHLADADSESHKTQPRDAYPEWAVIISALKCRKWQTMAHLVGIHTG